MVTLQKTIDAPIQISDVLILLLVHQFQFSYIPPFFLNVYLLHVLHCLDFLRCFDFDSLTTAI